MYRRKCVYARIRKGEFAMGESDNPTISWLYEANGIRLKSSGVVI